MHMLDLGNSWNSVFTVFEFAWHPHMTFLLLCTDKSTITSTASILVPRSTEYETLFEILEPSIVRSALSHRPPQWLVINKPPFPLASFAPRRTYPTELFEGNHSPLRAGFELAYAGMEHCIFSGRMWELELLPPGFELQS